MDYMIWGSIWGAFLWQLPKEGHIGICVGTTSVLQGLFGDGCSFEFRDLNLKLYLLRGSKLVIVICWLGSQALGLRII